MRVSIMCDVRLFFFSSRRRHTRWPRDWSSDVCSSDLNAENILAVDFLTTFAREARKYFGGLLLASQSINDFVPEYASSETVGKIKTLFELTKYKFIMQQDTNSLDTLRRIFDGEVSESEISEVPRFEQGDCLLAISGVQNMMLRVEASDEELSLFTGGL